MSKTSDKEAEVKIGSQEWRDKVIAPLYNTDEWQKYILSLLKPDELKEGYPSAAGLQRIARLLYASFRVHTTVVKTPTTEDRSATVHAEVTGNLQFGDQFEYLHFTSSADVYEFNTKSPFNRHPVATAETKAIGRALKLLMNLKIHTYEEMLEDETSYERINDIQKKSINLLLNKMEIDREKFLAAHAGVDPTDFENGNTPLSKSDGIKLLEILNLFQSKGVPSEFLQST